MSLICPVCASSLTADDKRLFCARGHSFDRARSGYWNLLMDPSSHGHGDDKAMLRARREFLSGGWYRPLAGAVADTAARLLPAGGSWTDAGCGEGYYTRAVLDAVADREARAYAFDVSKEAARMTASFLRGACTVFVASCYRVPLASESQDLILSLFSPYARAEYARLLKPGGFLLRAVPEEDHLWELKKALYELPRKNEAEPAGPDPDFDEIESIPVRGVLELRSRAVIGALFEMTPYARKTSPADRQKLEGLEALDVTFACRLLVSAKKTC